MTIEEIKQSDALWITPADVASVIGCNPNTLRETAQTNPALLGFPVTVVGSRVKVWRKRFLQYIGEG